MKHETKIIIVTTRNESPEEELAEKLTPLLSEGFRVSSASTSLAPWGKMDDSAYHVYYVTTVVLEISLSESTS